MQQLISNPLLSNEFLESYKKRSLPFGNDLSYLVYARTYSRRKADGSNEDWTDTIARVVEGCYDMQRRHIDKYHLGWDNDKAIDSAKEMFDRMWNMKFLPPGRGLWAMGTELTNGNAPLYAALNNCAFISTDKLGESIEESVKPFLFLMDLSMLGCGVGFDTNGARKVAVHTPIALPETVRAMYEYYDTSGARFYQLNFVEDSREGWVDSVRQLLMSYFVQDSGEVLFRYDYVRPKGTPIKKFGGIASGPDPLIKLHGQIREILDRRAVAESNLLTVRDIVDIMNLIGVCVVSGNVRRSAEIVFGSPYDDEYMKLKDYKFVDGEVIGSSADRIGFGWASNNSVFADLGMDYTKIANQIALNGEPGVAWLKNMQDYSRMGEKPDYKDYRVAGGNPCIIGSTLIAVADGRNAIPIKDLVGTEYDVYTRDANNDVVIGRSIKTWKTRENAEVWRLTLDDGSVLHATPDHDIMLEDGSYRPLRELRRGDVLMPYEVARYQVELVEFSHYEDVYDMTVDVTHNFAVVTDKQNKTFKNNSGIFVSNCLEQSLESGEVCCLVETFLPRHETINDYVRTLKFAYLYAKTVTLGQTHWIDTNRVMLRNRRIGTSQSGIAQFVEKHGLDTYKDWCGSGYEAIQHYDRVYSDWFCVRNSIKTTSIKPSGTVSLLPNVTPGMHWPTAKYYIRRIRIADDSPLLDQCRQAGLHIEADKYAASTMVVSLPCRIDIERTIDDVSMLEQMEMAAIIQEYWADNQVSCTVTFNPATEGHLIAQALSDYEHRLKGISFLPKLDESNAYEQAPYEKISKSEYEEMIKTVKPISEFLQNLNSDGQVELFCDGDTCLIK